MIVIINNVEYDCLPIFLNGGHTRFWASYCGSILILNKGKWKKKQSFIDDYGYVRVKLNWMGKKYYRRVHRLVAIAHIPNPENLPEVNHNDLDKTNNSVSNLEWCTKPENAKHAYDNGATKITGGYEHTRGRKIGKYLNGELIESFNSVFGLKKLGLQTSPLYRAVKNDKPYKGFMWKFL